MATKKHLQLIERTELEHLLNHGYSFKAIGKELNRDCTTIAKEVKHHNITKSTGSPGKSFNDCLHRFTCKYSRICNNPLCKHAHCKACYLCVSVCKEYKKQDCLKLKQAPYVCNGCEKKKSCALQKTFYIAKHADEQYRTFRSESRLGISIDEHETARLDNLFSPLIRKGQSIHHICSTHADTVMHSERSIYNYVDSSTFSARNIDLPRKVRYRPRKKSNPHKVDKTCRIGRTYEDFLAYIKENPDTPIVEIDSVEGTKGGKVLLTIHFVEPQLMIAFLRDANTAASVNDIFDDLYWNLGPNAFTKLFPVILTDNGSEFSNPLAIELDSQKNPRSLVFYCNPSAPYQKGAAENNHELIRRIVPKGNSFNQFNQNHIDLMMSHINSYGRKKLNDQSPNQLFSFLHGPDILEKLRSIPIPRNEIVLKPSLLKK